MRVQVTVQVKLGIFEVHAGENKIFIKHVIRNDIRVEQTALRKLIELLEPREQKEGLHVKGKPFRVGIERREKWVFFNDLEVQLRPEVRREQARERGFSGTDWTFYNDVHTQSLPCSGKLEKAQAIQRVGLGFDEARDVIRCTTIYGHIPEPLRHAHLIAGGIATGQSRGRT